MVILCYNYPNRINNGRGSAEDTAAPSSHRKGLAFMASSDHTTFDSATEEWRDIPGYEGLYQVSNLGRVRSCKLNNRPNRILKPYLNGNGYERVCLYSTKKQNRFIHQLVAEVFVGDRPSGYEINHINGNRLDNRALNLEYVTKQENIDHAVRIGLYPKGEKHHLAKVTNQMKVEILALKERKSSREVALQFGLSQSMVCIIWRTA